MSDRIRVGVIGAGRIGRIHAQNIATRVLEAELAAVADVDLSAAQAVVAQWRGGWATADYRALLNDTEIDAIAICSPTDTHARLIVEAAQVGKHIFCEKPIDHDLAQIDAALAAVERAGVKLQVGFNRRFDVNFAHVYQMRVAGQVGTPHLLRITSRDPAPPPLDYIKRSGGLFLDMTIHDFDMARYLMGCEVEELYVAGAVCVDPAIGAAGDLDTAVITLKFANGALGTIDNSRQAVYGYDQRVELFGSAGMVRVDNERPNTHEYSHAAGVEMAKPRYFFLERYMESFAAEMRAFVEAIREDTLPPVTGPDGRVPVVMALAARRSYEENRPVRLEEIGL